MARQAAQTHVPPVPDPNTRLLTSVSFATPVLYHFTRRICRGEAGASEMRPYLSVFRTMTPRRVRSARSAAPTIGGTTVRLAGCEYYSKKSARRICRGGYSAARTEIVESLMKVKTLFTGTARLRIKNFTTAVMTKVSQAAENRSPRRGAPTKTARRICRAEAEGCFGAMRSDGEKDGSDPISTRRHFAERLDGTGKM